MVKVFSTIIGILLSIIGILAYISTPKKHITALFPAFVGFPMVILSLVAVTDDEKAAAAMHGATAVSALGLIVSLQGLFFPQLFRSTADSDPGEHQERTSVQTATATLCGINQVIAIKSFVDARRHEENFVLKLETD
ncbi:MAG: hypothetical protein U9R25_01835 [Chloroflexota bacterium]|nr:hypothetical protein [Chloroflexota bacterium]